MNRSHFRVRLRGQKTEQVVGRLALLDLPDRGPFRPDVGEEGEGTALIERAPRRLPRAVGPRGTPRSPSWGG
jgi:hypothetical protein